ncbi:MAG: nucleotidyltransferase domain-containing protein [Oscillospiraceae bacterium]|nr:nucleotidyltransferase domain-containing protein [Oscillospiraceae bacterium]
MNNAIITNPDILAYRDIIINLIDPDKIILFGSYAYGEPNDNSDVDLCVVKNGKEHTHHDGGELRAKVGREGDKLNISTLFDVLLETDDSLQRGLTARGSAVDILQKGITIYERSAG